MQPVCFLEGIAIPDMCLAADVIESRYHCGPHEEIFIVEATTRKQKTLAKRLHGEWESQMSEFVELMEAK